MCRGGRCFECHRRQLWAARGVEGGLQLPTLPMLTLQGGGMLRSYRHGGECLGQAPHSCYHGVKGKIILRPAAVLGEEHGLSQGKEILLDLPAKLVHVFG